MRRTQKIPTPAPTKTIAYVRVSTEGQEEGMGLDVQRNAIVAYAALYGLQIDSWFQDVESGAKADRAGLRGIRGAVGGGGVARLLVYRLDRIARDVLLAETFYRELTAADCKVISVSEMIDDSPSGHLMRTILAGFAQYERAVIALRTSAGRRAKVSTQGTFHGGPAPFGYRAVGRRGSSGEGRLVVHEGEANAVRRVFALDREHRTQKEIAQTLNAEGYRTARGAAFTATQVCRILKRYEVYAGRAATTRSVPLATGVVPKHSPILTAERTAILRG